VASDLPRAPAGAPAGIRRRRVAHTQLIDLRSHGVTTEYLKGFKEAGYDLGADAVVRLRMHGVPVDFARRARRLGDAGMRDLTAEQIASLRAHGVD